MSDLFLGFYLGVFSIILLFNILAFVYYKQRAYIYYFLMHLFVVFLSLSTNKLFESDLVIFFVVAIIFFSFLFAKEFLNLSSYYKNLDAIITRIAFSSVVFLLALYSLGGFNLIILIPYSMMFLALVLIALDVYKKGFKLAIYFIIGWGLNFLIVLLLDLKRIFGIEIVDFIYLNQLGNILEAVILSFALFARTKTIEKEKDEKEKMLIHQSRLASMGEMLANISHQWRQPLNRIASFIMNMQIHIMDNYKEEKYLLEKLDESQIQLEYMSSTIDDFTNFYKKDKQKESFFVSSVVENSISIILPTLKSNNINLDVKIIKDFQIKSYPKELSQVILNLIQNAKDALIINKTANANIQIEITDKKIVVQNNGESINENIIDKIFEPYFTTKEKHKGTGLGLYMSRMILEKNMNASISVENKNDNVHFEIIFNK
ncbi:sensor histidine kinase [Poseidonibacter lekithochrous]|uniref:sensor histidine kinase n=1 Tax=Poseidonibacter lekithochrous TaxID=1904463 RepID=UPI0008FCA88E|nr:sensor histidine kinase [Poseidonibacter lekithochrous]QKJ21957.1 7TMR-DISM-7TM domain-containing two-component system sensor histidine kinase [Poseidonibacter lekithochrous]